MRKRYMKAKQESALKKGFEQIAKQALKDSSHLYVDMGFVYTPRIEDMRVRLEIGGKRYISASQFSDVNQRMTGEDYLKLEDLPF